MVGRILGHSPLHFMGVAVGSASEARYLLEVALRLEYIAAADHERLEPRFQELVRGLYKLIEALDARLP